MEPVIPNRVGDSIRVFLWLMKKGYDVDHLVGIDSDPPFLEVSKRNTTIGKLVFTSDTDWDFWAYGQWNMRKAQEIAQSLSRIRGTNIHVKNAFAWTSGDYISHGIGNIGCAIQLVIIAAIIAAIVIISG